MTASMSDSSTSTTMPTDSNMCLATERSFSVAYLPGQMAVAASLTTAAMFGIALTTGTLPPSFFSMLEVVTPAATDITSFESLRAGLDLIHDLEHDLGLDCKNNYVGEFGGL